MWLLNATVVCIFRIPVCVDKKKRCNRCSQDGARGKKQNILHRAAGKAQINVALTSLYTLFL